MSLSPSGQQAPMTRGRGPSALRRPSSSRPPTGRCVRVQAIQLPFGLNRRNSKAGKQSKADALAQAKVLDILKDARGRGKEGLSEEQKDTLVALVEQLESSRGVQSPTATDAINGQWRLLYTSRPGTSSPIQRTFTGVEGFKVFQEVYLQGEEMARINNCVDFGKNVGILRVEAEANTDTRPIPDFVPRRGAGLPIFGKSSSEPPFAEDTRIDFQFDRAAFDFYKLPFKIPYPVPFRLVGDEGKGWIDVTYMDPEGTFRISRGNKGTTFILVKDEGPALSGSPSSNAVASKSSSTSIDDLMAAVDSGNDASVEELIESIRNPTRSPAKSPLTQGKWRLRWSAQADNANPLQKAFANQVRNFQILYEDEDGVSRVENLVQFAPFLKIRAEAFGEPGGADRSMIDIKRVVIEAGPLKIPFKVERPEPGYVDWLYLDDAIRVTRGSKGSVFIHSREPESP